VLSCISSDVLAGLLSEEGLNGVGYQYNRPRNEFGGSGGFGGDTGVGGYRGRPTQAYGPPGIGGSGDIFSRPGTAGGAFGGQPSHRYPQFSDGGYPNAGAGGYQGGGFGGGYGGRDSGRVKLYLYFSSIRKESFLSNIYIYYINENYYTCVIGIINYIKTEIYLRKFMYTMSSYYACVVFCYSHDHTTSNMT